VKRKIHDHRYRKVLQRPKGLRLHPARRRRQATALERAGIRGLREGQKVTFEAQTDPRSGKIAADKLEAM
jgi:hypothetical protein